MNNSERDYANSIYDGMYETGQKLAADDKERQLKNIWNAAIEAVINKLDSIGHTIDKDIEAIRKLKK